VTAPVYGLTPGQADCARVIAALTDFEGDSPSFAEIARELGCSKSEAVRLVICLIERGWIERPPKYAMGALRLTRSPPPFDGRAVDITEAGRLYLEKHAA